MTDDEANRDQQAGRPATLGDPGMPSAGRRPGPDATPRADADAGLRAGGEPDSRRDGDAGSRAESEAGSRSGVDAGAGGRSGSEPVAPEGDAALDPEAPISADGPTVRLSSALPGLSVESTGLDDPAAVGSDHAGAGGEPARSDAAGSGEPDGPADEPAADPDEPTVVSGTVDRDDEATTLLRPPAPVDEATTLLTPPPVGVDEEPTVPATRPRSLDGGATMRLQPPFFAPETTRAPRAAPAADEPEPAHEESPDHPDAETTAGPDHGDSNADRWDDTTAEPGGWDAEPDRWNSATAEPEPWRDSSAWTTTGSQQPDAAPTGDDPRARSDDDAAERWHDDAAYVDDDATNRWHDHPAGADDQPTRADSDAAEPWRDEPTRADRDPAEPWREEPARDASERWHDELDRADEDPAERWHDNVSRAAAAEDDSARDRAAAIGSDTPVSPAVVTSPGEDRTEDPAADVPEKGVPDKAPPGRRFSSAGALIWVLLALLGFTLVVQLQSNDDDAGLATARQEDLVGILSDLEARDQRLQQEINALEESQRQLTSGVAGRQAALAEAGKRADELGLLSGTLPARGPGLKISIDPRGQPIKASAILNAVQELRGAGGEVMEIIGDNGVAVRIVASSYFVDADGGQVIVDGKQLSGPYTLWVIGVPSTMQTALQIPGGVVASVSQAGGNVTMEQRSTVEVAAVRQPTSLQYARPVS